MFIETLSSDPRFFFVVVITVVLSICLHELAHGVVAIWYGDRTPIETGHMTMNPLVHMGYVSMAMLALAGIAWGLMPINPSRMRGRHAPAVVALAGPAVNLLLAVVSLTIVGLWVRIGGGSAPSPLELNVRYFLRVMGIMNVTLLLFNLIPLPPLDGSRILADLSRGYAELMGRLMRNGQAGIAFLVLFYFGGSYLQSASLYLTSHYLRWILGR